MSDNQAQHFTLDLENFSKNFVPIHQGLPYIRTLMERFKKMYPELRHTPLIKFKNDPNIVARALMLTPESPSEIYFVAIREGERQDMYFLTKYFNEITEYIMKNPEESSKE